ncbi:MAG: NAD(P)H-hydrate dehydratase [Caldisericaceae bacterium]
MKIAHAKEIAYFDSLAKEKYGITSELLMENAGNAVYNVIRRHTTIEGKRFAVFCGTGGNGGDGFVAARKLASEYGNVSVFIVGDKGKINGASLANLNRLAGFPIEVLEISHINRIVETAIMNSDVLIDAIFGVGLSRPLEGIFEDIVNEINRSNKFILSVDIPSGINADNGNIMGVAVKASCTVTFGLPKLGEFQYPGADYVGELYVSKISYPPEITESLEINTELNIPNPLPQRKRDSHKGDFGKALFISGSRNYLGAPFFNSLAFLKSGGGVAILATISSIASITTTLAREVITMPLVETDSGTISYKNLNALLDKAEQVDVVAIGSGLGQNAETEELVLELLRKINKPIIIDGDGLTMISRNTNLLSGLDKEIILTPHLGEFARLTNVAIDDIKQSKFNYLYETANKLKATIILKGAFSLIGCKNGKIFVNPSGNSGMATAGSGDVLVGIIAAMIGIGQGAEESSKLGTFIHGLSGDMQARKIGEDGLTASDILQGIPEAISFYREHYKEIKESNYERARLI